VAALSESRTFRHEKHAIQGRETAMTSPLTQIQWKEPEDG